MKQIIILSIFIYNLYAGLVNAIAILVNNQPITLYDIDNEMTTNNLPKQTAINKLVDEILYQQELKKYNVTVDMFDIDDYIEKLAKRNNMNIFDFKNLVRQQQNYELFRLNIKNQLLHQKLIKKIAQGKLKLASDDDILLYYENHKDKFQIANKIDVIHYSSTNKRALQQLKQNPMLQDSSISMQTTTLTQNMLTPQEKYIINTTKPKSFSVIFAQNRKYHIYFVQDKKDITTIPLKQVKNQIFQIIMQQREQSYLKEYFETLKITANIKTLR